MTIHDLLYLGLTALGWHATQDQPSRKYVQFEHPKHNEFAYLGKRTALRRGFVASRSRDATIMFRAEVLAAGKRAAAKDLADYIADYTSWIEAKRAQRY